MTSEETLTSVLRGIGALTAIVGNRIHHETPPEGTSAYPRVVFTLLDEESLKVLASQVPLTRAVFLVEAQVIDAADGANIRAAINTVGGTKPANTNWVWVDSGSTSFEATPSLATEKGVRKSSCEVTIWH